MSNTLRTVILAACLAALTAAWIIGRWWALSERRDLQRRRRRDP
jgi:hypothetical protein